MRAVHRLAAVICAVCLALWLVPLATSLNAARVTSGGSGLLWVAFPPWIAETYIVREIVTAGGRPVRASAWPGIWVAFSETDDFALRLQGAGAWAFRDLPFSAELAGCIAYASPVFRGSARRKNREIVEALESGRRANPDSM